MRTAIHLRCPSAPAMSCCGHAEAGSCSEAACNQSHNTHPADHLALLVLHVDCRVDTVAVGDALEDAYQISWGHDEASNA